MAGSESYSPYLIIGKLSRDFILTREGNDINNISGGHLLYSAIGMSPWEKNPGLVSRVGKNYPPEFLDRFTKYHLNVENIRILDTDLEHRNFISFFEPETELPYRADRNRTSVLSRYFHAGKVFPKDLLGYTTGRKHMNSLSERTRETVLVRDIPRNYLEARCIHLCPLDYLSHNLLPQAFSGNTKPTITVQSGSAYMNPYFFDAVKTVVSGLSAFITRERYLRSLFAEKYRINDLDDMMKTLLDYGAENIVVKTASHSYKFINRVDRTVNELPLLSGEKYDNIGELSCFCGAYLIGLNETYDHKKAMAYGAARASLLRNEINPFSNLDVLESLLQEKIRRMESLI